MSEEISNKQEQRIATITFNRPKVLNALTIPMLDELEGMIDRLNEDESCKVIIITGEGRSFAAGADISCMKEASPQEAMRFSKTTTRLFRKIELARPFTIAAVNGYALGGGLELALACDVRVAADTAKLGLTETAIGSFPGSGGTMRLPKLVGLGRAKELLATAEKVPAARAMELGMVEHIVPSDKLMEFCRELAKRICKNSRNAIADGKRLMTLSYEMDAEKACELMTFMIGMNYGSKDQREGMRAFLEKREPHFE